MCDPTVALIASLASGAYQTIGQAQASKQNAAFARYEADQTKEIGRANEMQARDRMSRLIAQQRAQLATRGVRLDSASALDLGDEAARQKFIEGQAQRFNTDLRVKAKSNEAAIYDYQAQVGLMNGAFGVAAKGFGQALDLWPELRGA